MLTATEEQVDWITGSGSSKCAVATAISSRLAVVLLVVLPQQWFQLPLLAYGRSSTSEQGDEQACM
jgi:hypothetical protein